MIDEELDESPSDDFEDDEYNYCELCSGTGHVEELASRCPECDGLGYCDD